MSARCLRMVLLFSVLGAGALAQSDAADTALEHYLERLGQRSLLIEDLEQRLERTPNAERPALAERLTELVAEELESATTPARRAALERRARALLDVIPEGDSIDLRLSLHRAAYANAEEIAERWRLRLAQPEEVEEAKRVFPSVAADLARLGAVANRRVENLERLEEAAHASTDDEDVMTQLSDARRQRSMAMYLSAWCLTYQAELENARAPALEALPRYGWLLNAEPGQAPTIERVPESTLAYEHVARAALGVATAIGVAGDASLAERWIELVETAKGVTPEVLAQAEKRRMTLLARAARWTELNQRMDSARGETNSTAVHTVTPLDAATARLLAVLAFELPAGRAGPAQLALRRTAFADLIARNEVGQVVDLASRYGTDALGENGFISDYVRGLQAYRAATEAQRAEDDPEAPATNPAIRQQFQLAVRLLDAALRASDAGMNPGARADALMLGAVSAYLSSADDAEGLRAAADRADAAFDASDNTARRADALWLRVRALRARRDLLGVSGSPSSSLDDARAMADEATARFTQTFPSDPRAGALVLERASIQDAPATDAGTLDALLAIDASSPSYNAARRRAAALLFELASHADASSARRTALRFVEVAGPILDADAQRALAGDKARAEQAGLLARQVLALLLADKVAEAGLAQRAADRLDALVRAGLIGDPAIIAELRYRELQIALFNDDPSRMDAALDALSALDPSIAARYLEAADRLAYRRAVTQWREAPGDAVRAGQVVRYGVRVLASLGESDERAEDPGVLSTMMLVSDAATVLWRERDDAEALRLARRLVRRALVGQPNSIELLRRSAQLAVAENDFADAAAIWDKVRAGAELGTDAWFEATAMRLEALAKSDPALGRDEVARHLDLFPKGGPLPWGERILRVRLALEGGAP